MAILGNKSVDSIFTPSSLLPNKHFPDHRTTQNLYFLLDHLQRSILALALAVDAALQLTGFCEEKAVL